MKITIVRLSLSKPVFSTKVFDKQFEIILAKLQLYV
jgi:hypothetical protein